MPELPQLFASAEAQEAMERTIALHLLRTGQFNAVETFFHVCFTIEIEIQSLTGDFLGVWSQHCGGN